MNFVCAGWRRASVALRFTTDQAGSAARGLAQTSDFGRSAISLRDFLELGAQANGSIERIEASCK
jgi:hypothetical protein